MSDQATMADNGVREQVRFWKLDVPEWVVANLESRRWGLNRGQTANLYAWDLVRRGAGMTWGVVMENIDAGYPEPPTWMERHAIECLLKIVAATEASA